VTKTNSANIIEHVSVKTTMNDSFVDRPYSLTLFARLDGQLVYFTLKTPMSLQTTLFYQALGGLCQQLPTKINRFGDKPGAILIHDNNIVFL
jgi:hypothetical protein